MESASFSSFGSFIGHISTPAQIPALLQPVSGFKQLQHITTRQLKPKIIQPSSSSPTLLLAMCSSSMSWCSSFAWLLGKDAGALGLNGEGPTLWLNLEESNSLGCRMVL